MATRRPPLPTFNEAAEASDAVDEAAAAFPAAIRTWCAALDMTPIVTKYQAWQAQAEVAVEAVSVLAWAYEEYCNYREDAWYDSEHGQAAEALWQALEAWDMRSEAAYPLSLYADPTYAWAILTEDVYAVLPETPALPPAVTVPAPVGMVDVTRPLPSLDEARAACAAVDEAWQTFMDAVDAWCMELDVAPLAGAYAIWQAKVATLTAVVADLAMEYEQHCADRSDRWLDSERGQAVQQVAQELAHCQMDDDVLDVLRLTADPAAGWTVTLDNGDEVLPETPELPEEAD
jgi:hypothetical protein